MKQDVKVLPSMTIKRLAQTSLTVCDVSWNGNDFYSTAV